MNKLGRSFLVLLGATFLCAAGCAHQPRTRAAAENMRPSTYGPGGDFRGGIGGGPGRGDAIETSSTRGGTADSVREPSHHSAAMEGRAAGRSESMTHGLSNGGYSTGSGSPGSSTAR